MIRYGYNQQIEPPAPFIIVTLRHPYEDAEITDVPAQFDTGADRSLLPLSLVETLGLPESGETRIGGVGGKVESMPLYGVLLGGNGIPLRPVEIVAHPDEPWALLGRDGPNLRLEIG